MCSEKELNGTDLNEIEVDVLEHLRNVLNQIEKIKVQREEEERIKNRIRKIFTRQSNHAKALRRPDLPFRIG
jgi:hypothetical protein